MLGLGVPPFIETQQMRVVVLLFVALAMMIGNTTAKWGPPVDPVPPSNVVLGPWMVAGAITSETPRYTPQIFLYTA